MRPLLALFALLVLAMGCRKLPPEVAASPSLTLATTRQGLVEGRGEAAYVAFRGIPYAAPPVGERRFAPPEPPPPRRTILEAHRFRDPCVQRGGLLGVGPGSEDCLYLNVFRPRAPTRAPVMVWLHGGAFEFGSADRYDPAALVAEHDVVVVTMNYRLGILGFLAHPALADADGDAGDYGLMDQQAALRWVRENIAAFGGDPEQITIFGESAGGLSVLSHLVSPPAAGLFDRAIVQSGAYALDTPTMADNAEQDQALARALGCVDAACLREVPPRRIRRAQRKVDAFFVPTLRSDLLPRSLGEAIAGGAFARVPVLMGTNLDEWRLFVALDAFLSLRPRPRAYPREVERVLDVADLPTTLAPTVTEAYPMADHGRGRDGVSRALGALGTDVVFACPSLELAQGLAAHVDTFVYEFADRDAPNLLPLGVGFDLGAAHAFELAYVFGDRSRRARRMSAPSLALADAMTTWWATFARTGDPNPGVGGLPTWPVAGGALSLQAPRSRPSSLQALSVAHRCALWRSLGELEGAAPEASRR